MRDAPGPPPVPFTDAEARAVAVVIEDRLDAISQDWLTEAGPDEQADLASAVGKLYDALGDD